MISSCIKKNTAIALFSKTNKSTNRAGVEGYGHFDNFSFIKNFKKKHKHFCLNSNLCQNYDCHILFRI